MASILIVDDHAANREFVATLLGYKGHQTLEAADGAEGLAAVRDKHPDLVICDILMPTMDGFEFVRQLRADPAVADTEVVFYTANYREREARNLADASGVSHILMKPCEPQEVLRVVDLALAHSRAALPAPSTAEFDREHLRVMTDKLAEKANQLQFANERLSALTELNLQLASERDPRTLLGKVCRGARELFGAKYVILGARAKSGESVDFFAVAGFDEEAVARLKHPVLDQGLLGRLLVERKACRYHNPGGDPRKIGLPAGYPPTHSCIIAPIISIGHAYGWICLIDKLGAEEFSEDDERETSILGAQVGRIYENGSLYAEIRRHATRLEHEVDEHKKTTEFLRRSEHELSGLIESTVDAIISLDENLTVVLFNPAAENMFGYATQEMLGQPLDRLLPEAVRKTHPDHLAAFRGEGAKSRSMRGSQTVVGLHKSGRQILIRASISFNKAGSRKLYTAILRDVTAQVEAESKIRRLNRIYAVLSGINTLIVRVRDRDTLFREACKIAVEAGQFRLAWIAITDPETNRVSPAAWAGDEQGYLSLTRPLADAAPSNRQGITIRAMHKKSPIVCNDIESDRELLLSPSEAIKRGYRSVISLPLIAGDESIGALILYAGEMNFFDEQEIKLLDELAGDISFALEHIQKTEKLDYLAYYDELTGLPNRTLLRDYLGRVLRRAKEEQTSAAFLMCDIKRFRLINETLGRKVGDSLLREVASRLKRIWPEPDNVGRISADCFGGIVANIKDGSDLAHLIEQPLANALGDPVEVDGEKLRISLSIGIATFPLDGDDPDVLMRNAESALMKAKTGAESFTFYTQQMTERVAERLSLENKLRRALEQEEFVLHYQPKVDLVSGAITGVEALIRWNDPEAGLVPPAHFIPLLEETGLILNAGSWAMMRAVLDHRHWQELGLAAPRIAVNVSPIQLQQRDFVETVKQAVAFGTLPPGIDLEITESLLMSDVGGNIAKLVAIREMGMTIYIDDFGTGYSSLGYLAKLPVQSLKIDRSFVITMMEDPNTMTLVSTIISLAHSLRLKVVAEGVDKEEQARMLRLLRCEEMQGFLYSKPLPRDEMTKLLQRG